MKKLMVFLGVTLVLFSLSMILVNPASADRDRPRRPTRTPTPTRISRPTRTHEPEETRRPTRTPTGQIGSTPTRTPTPVSASPTPVTVSVTPDSDNPHASIQSYDGPQTCIACHSSEAESALHSEHMQWAGKWKEVNTYCTAPEPADFACRTCHASTGKVTNLTVNDVDCLVCHSDAYKRALGPQTNAVTVVDWQGTTKVYNFPVKVNGDYQMLPRFDLMPAGTTMVDLARNVHLPTVATCLRCHAGAGGANGAKRGDIFMELKDPALSPDVDVHISPSGANLNCQACHVPQDHLIPGKGIDLRVSEGGTVTCTQCHEAKPHGETGIDQHTDRVACQTCHIPTYGKVTGTEMSRDWIQPKWSETGCNGQGAWVGQDVWETNVIPTYTFWNGQSEVYDLTQPIAADPDGSYTLSRALGSINDGKLYPIKVHTSNQPRENSTGRMVAYDVLWNFLTGKFEEAAQRGVDFMGLPGGYTWVNTRAEQLITHGVEPQENALECAACHSSRTQMDLRTLGYVLKGPQSQVCTQCHEQESNPGFNDVHNKHVESENIDCSMCHAFTRPERGLSIGITD